MQTSINQTRTQWKQYNTGSTTEGGTNKNVSFTEANYETGEWLGASTCVLEEAIRWFAQEDWTAHTPVHWRTKVNQVALEAIASEQWECTSISRKISIHSWTGHSGHSRIELWHLRNVWSQQPRSTMRNLSSVAINSKLHSMTLLKHGNQKSTHSNRNSHTCHKRFIFKTQYCYMWIFQQWIFKWDWATRVLIGQLHQLWIHKILPSLLQMWGCRTLGKRNANTNHHTCEIQTPRGKYMGECKIWKTIQQDIWGTTWPMTTFVRHISTLSLKNSINTSTLRINDDNSNNM